MEATKENIAKVAREALADAQRIIRTSEAFPLEREPLELAFLLDPECGQ